MVSGNQPRTIRRSSCDGAAFHSLERAFRFRPGTSGCRGHRACPVPRTTRMGDAGHRTQRSLPWRAEKFPTSHSGPFGDGVVRTGMQSPFYRAKLTVHTASPRCAWHEKPAIPWVIAAISGITAQVRQPFVTPFQEPGSFNGSPMASSTGLA